MEALAPFWPTMAMAIWGLVYILLRRSGAARRDLQAESTAFERLGFDPDLGEILYSQDARMLMFSPRLNGRTVELVLCEAAPEKSAVYVALKIASGLDELDRTGREFAAGELLDLVNREWRAKGQAPYDCSSFLAQLVLERVTASPDRSFSLVFGSGDMFRGLPVQVSGDLRKGPASAYLLT